MESYQDHQNQLKVRRKTRSAIYKLVDIFSGITGKPLWISDGPAAETDLRHITVPMDDPYAYVLTEHEISHILFKSDAQAKVFFVQQYTEEVVKIAADNHVEIHPELIEKALDMIIGIIEDHRVNSLWGVLYPGSYGRLRRMTQDIYLGFIDMAHLNLLVYFGCLEAGVEARAPRYDRYRKYMEEALRKVELKSFAATLAMSKWLVMRLVDVIIEEALGTGHRKDVKVRSQAVQQLSNEFRQIPDKLSEVAGDVQQPKDPSYRETEEAQKLADEVLRKPSDDLASYASQSGSEMRKIIEKARQTLRQRMTKEDYLRKNALARVVFRDVTSKDLDPALLDWTSAMDEREKLKRNIRVTAKPYEEAQLTNRLHLIEDFLRNAYEDTETTKRLKAVFHRVMGKKKIALYDDGVEVDVSAVIERRTTGMPVPCFRTQVSGRGFKAMILIDRSVSMEGSKTIQVERACKILAASLRFPFVDLTIWGFQSLEDGQVDIIRYDPSMTSFSTSLRDVGGGTPLHVATRLGFRHLQDGADSKHLFVLTDGFPQYALKDGRIVATSQLMRWTRQEIRRARRDGVNVTGILVGQEIGDQIHYDLNPGQMSFMFGPKRHWRFMAPAKIGRDLVRLVTGSFLTYLNHG
jgi:hypothetical protein